MHGASFLVSTALVSAACAGGADRVDVAQPPLPAGVYVLTPDDMYSFCNMVDPNGKPVDPEGICEDFRTAPSDVIARIEARVPSLLAARGSAIDRYVRQYWAVFQSGKLYVIGNFTCRSLLEQPLDDIDGDPMPPLEQSLAHIPVVIDDGGACHVTLSVPADQPGAVEF